MLQWRYSNFHLFSSQPKNADEYLGNWNGTVFEITPLAFHIQDLNGITSLKDHQNFPKYQERIKIS